MFASFDDNTIISIQKQGVLTIKGSDCILKSLAWMKATFGRGYIISCVYNDKIDTKKAGNFFSNIFK